MHTPYDETNPAAYPGGYPPRSVKAALIASLTDGTVVPFDPMTFVASAFKARGRESKGGGVIPSIYPVCTTRHGQLIISQAALFSNSQAKLPLTQKSNRFKKN